MVSGQWPVVSGQGPGASGQGPGARQQAEGGRRKAEGPPHGLEASSHGPGAQTAGAGAAAEGLPIDACGECPVCRRIERGLYPDVVVVEPGDTGSIKIDVVRAVIAETAYKPFEGRRRVVIVDEADRMGADAQDSLLKSLEEPPPNSMFVLISARADTLAPTVRSRCSRLRFGRLGPAEIQRALVRDHGYTEEDARALAALAGGSLAGALEAESSGFGEMRAAACRTLGQVAEAADPRGRLDSVRELVDRRGAGPTVGSDRDDLARRLAVLSVLVRDLAILSTRAHGDALVNLDLTSELRSLSRSYGRERAVRAFYAADRALSALRRNASPKIVADWLVLHL